MKQEYKMIYNISEKEIDSISDSFLKTSSTHFPYDINEFYNKLDLLLMKNFGLLIYSSRILSYDLIEILVGYNNKTYTKVFILHLNYFYTINEILEYVYAIIIRNCKITDFVYYFGKEIHYILD